MRDRPARWTLPVLPKGEAIAPLTPHLEVRSGGEGPRRKLIQKFPKMRSQETKQFNKTPEKCDRQEYYTSRGVTLGPWMSSRHSCTTVTHGSSSVVRNPDGKRGEDKGVSEGWGRAGRVHLLSPKRPDNN